VPRHSDTSQTKSRGQLGLSRLVDLTGVPAATLHHWLRLQLLPPPVRLGARRNVYDERHVRAARLIRVLREHRRLPLEEIAAVLPTLMEVDEQEAFRPEMWNAAIAAQIRQVQPAEPPTELLDAAVAAFTQAGYAEVRVDDVCAAVGMAKGSFYRWFVSKDDAFNAAVRHVGAKASHELSERELPKTPDDAVGLLVTVMAPHVPLLLEAGVRAVRGDAGAAEALLGSVEAIQLTLAERSGLRSRAARRWLETVFGRAALTAVGIRSP
jgi:AcrR family transcriptional regulator/predicted DNA-binding transcriptional regulator AlpA